MPPPDAPPLSAVPEPDPEPPSSGTVITRVEVTHHAVELDPPFVAAWDSRPRTVFEATLVSVHTDDGRVGHGSGDLMIGFEAYEHLFVGHDPLHLDRHGAVLDNLQFHGGRCWPLDLALWDLAGIITGQPVWQLLGGRSDRVRCYASSGVRRDPVELADQAERYLAEGFGAMKLRLFGSDWRDGVERVSAVRDRVGDRLEIMVDCNQGWRMPHDTDPPWTYDDALPVARALAELDVYWMEEPLHRGDYEGMARLREATDVRIAAAEMTRELHELTELITRGCVDVIQPDAALVGGITGLRRIATLAEAHGVMFTPHTWTNGLALLANAHLTAGVGDAAFLEFPYDPPEWSIDRRDFLLPEPVRADGGWLVLGDDPGLGSGL